MLQGKAIVNHDVQRIIQQNGFATRESSEPPGPVVYPWGLPFLLAMEGSLFSFDLRVFKLFNILIFLLLVLAIFWFARRFLTATEALAAACMFAFNPVLLHYCNHILTELPFTLLSVCAFIAMENRDSRERPRILFLLASGMLAFMAFTFRTNGILLLAAITAREFLPGAEAGERGWHWPPVSALLLPYVAFGALYALWSVLFPGGGDGHLQVLRAVSVDTVIDNALTYPVSLFDFFTGGHRSAVVAGILGPFVLLGAFTTWRRTAHLSVYGLLTLALYFVWPAHQGYRFMIPVTPVLVIFMMLGLDWFAHWNAVRNSVGPILAGLIYYGVPVLFLTLASLLVATGRLPKEKWNPYDQSSAEMFQWVRTNTSGGTVIAFFKPRAMHLLGQRLCLTGMPPDIRKASFFVYTKERIWNEEQPPLSQYQKAAELTPVFENMNFVIFRVGVTP